MPIERVVGIARSANLRRDVPGLARRGWRVLLETYHAWRDGRTIRLGAALAFYGLFSLASVVAVTLWLVRVLFRSSDIEEFLTERLGEAFGEIGAQIGVSLSEGIETGGSGLGLVGIVSLLVTGSLFFVALEDALNQIWGEPVKAGLWWTVRRRLVALVVLLAAAATIVASVAVQAVTTVLERFVPGFLPGLSGLAALLASVATWTVLLLAIVLLFRFLPAARVGWREAIVAGVLTSALLVLGTAAIGWYLRTFGATSVTGAASAVFAVLLWIFYEAQILLAGAQLCAVLNRPPAPPAGETDDETDGDQAGVRVAAVPGSPEPPETAGATPADSASDSASASADSATASP